MSKKNEPVIIKYFGKPHKVQCDRMCSKAWGINNRPNTVVTPDLMNFVYLSDGELGDAPDDPGSYKGGHAKPLTPDDFPNTWCVRECERSVMVEIGEEVRLPDWSERHHNGDDEKAFKLEDWEEKFITSTLAHIGLVQKVCFALRGVGFDVSDHEVYQHDKSKFSYDEFEHYARRIFGPNDDKAGWEKALMHHYKNNEHHWEYYLEGYKKVGEYAGCTPKPMPLEQVVIMVADRFACAKQYDDKWDITGWLNDNLDYKAPKIILHALTEKRLNHVLARLGYNDSCDNEPIYCLQDNYFIKMLDK